MNRDQIVDHLPSYPKENKTNIFGESKTMNRDIIPEGEELEKINKEYGKAWERINRRAFLAAKKIGGIKEFMDE